MNVTKGRFNNRQLHTEDYLQMVSAEQREYAEVLDYQRIAENNHIITDFWTNSLLDEYSYAMKSHFRKSGNQMSGKWKSSYASLLA